MDNQADNKLYMKNQGGQRPSNFNLKFLERRKQALRQSHQKRKQAQLTEQQQQKQKKSSVQPENLHQSNNRTLFVQRQNPSILPQTQKQTSRLTETNKQTSTFSSLLTQDNHKKASPQDILSRGKIQKIVERTLTHDQYRVQCYYGGEIVQLIASKQEILRNNIIPLLDYYEKVLGLR